MNQKIYCFKKSIFLLLAASITLAGCQKEGALPVSEPQPKNQIASFEQLQKFVAWSLGVAKDSVKFNSDTKEFYLPNTVVKESLKTVQDEYEKANIYKNEIENK